MTEPPTEGTFGEKTEYHAYENTYNGRMGHPPLDGPAGQGYDNEQYGNLDYGADGPFSTQPYQPIEGYMPGSIQPGVDYFQAPQPQPPSYWQYNEAEYTQEVESSHYPPPPYQQAPSLPANGPEHALTPDQSNRSGQQHMTTRSGEHVHYASSILELGGEQYRGGQYPQPQGYPQLMHPFVAQNVNMSNYYVHPSSAQAFEQSYSLDQYLPAPYYQPGHPESLPAPLATPQHGVEQQPPAPQDHDAVQQHPQAPHSLGHDRQDYTNGPSGPVSMSAPPVGAQSSYAPTDQPRQHHTSGGYTQPDADPTTYPPYSSQQNHPPHSELSFESYDSNPGGLSNTHAAPLGSRPVQLQASAEAPRSRAAKGHGRAANKNTGSKRKRTEDGGSNVQSGSAEPNMAEGSTKDETIAGEGDTNPVRRSPQSLAAAKEAEYAATQKKPDDMEVTVDSKTLTLRYTANAQLEGGPLREEVIKAYVENAIANRKLKIWIQNPPAECKARLEPCYDQHCLSKKCPDKANDKNRPIKNGFLRVAFDERSKEIEDGLHNPFKYAGVMHLYCFEKMYGTERTRQLYKDKVLQPDTHERIFPKETDKMKKKMRINRDDHNRDITTTVEEWSNGKLLADEFTKRVSKTDPKGANKKRYFRTLCFWLTKHHITKETKARNTTRTSRNEGLPDEEKKSIDMHCGNLESYIDAVALRIKKQREERNKAKANSAPDPQAGPSDSTAEQGPPRKKQRTQAEQDAEPATGTRKRKARASDDGPSAAEQHVEQPATMREPEAGDRERKRRKANTGQASALAATHPAAPAPAPVHPAAQRSGVPNPPGPARLGVSQGAIGFAVGENTAQVDLPDNVDPRLLDSRGPTGWSPINTYSSSHHGVPSMSAAGPLPSQGQAALLPYGVDSQVSGPYYYPPPQNRQPRREPGAPPSRQRRRAG